MTKINHRTSLSPSCIRKRNLPTPPPSVSDINDSSSCSSTTSSSSYSTINPSDNNNHTVASCDLLNILTDVRFRPVFQAIDEIKRRKCRPDLERILKYVSKRSTTKNLTEQRNEILSILDDLLKYGLITKVFHKGGFTIRIKNEKYTKLIENLNLCYNSKSSSSSSSTTTTTSISSHESLTSELIDQSWSITNSNETIHHKRETPSPEFAVFKAESLPEKCQMTKENNLISNKKRNRSQTYSTTNKNNKKSRLIDTSDSIEHIVRKPLVTNNNLPPVTIEQLLGLRGDIPDVHNWTIDELIEFFHQQGYDYASILLNQYHINGNKLYELTREQVFHMSTLKIGKALKLWNVIEQIQRNNHSLSSK
ncbi:unnamed protein product [Rotaria sordida]|uniref:SAMD1-like winged helix (WH) domain-containing protein n=1 Tax=Rotaria sordida TaxID=392033 RepID=A0A814FW60_9BILA|nr:unnamed protein product [Rotaria sordida]CAF0990276.1 unnamed protein product [Rotaria sordida]CAF3771347.1 unnamed protein product [Rotaria sordida]CAF3971988.1 unnamed protein product [Rotaria sordida]